MGPNTKEDLHDTPPGNRREGSNNVAQNMNFLKGYSPMTKNKRIEGETNHKVRRKECALSTVCFTTMVGVESFTSQERKKIRQVSSNLEIQTENGIVRSTTQARVYIQELVTYCRWEDCAKSRDTPTAETRSTPQLAKKGIENNNLRKSEFRTHRGSHEATANVTCGRAFACKRKLFACCRRLRSRHRSERNNVGPGFRQEWYTKNGISPISLG